MREYSTPRAGPAPTTGSLTDPVVANAEHHGTTVVFLRRHPAASSGATAGPFRGWAEVSAADFHADVRRTAAGLLAAGIRPGDRVALLSRTRYEGTLLDYAAWYVGAATVPVHESETPDGLAHILRSSQATALFVERDHLDRLTPVADAHHREHTADGRPAFFVWPLDDAGEGAAIDRLAALGASTGPEELEARRAAVGPADLATLVHTSGTVGSPQACALTHGNLMSAVTALRAGLPELFGDTVGADAAVDPAADPAADPAVDPAVGAGATAATVLFLPFAHVLTRVLQVAAVSAGVRLAHLRDVDELSEQLTTLRPTFLLTVPSALEQLMGHALQQATVGQKDGSVARATDVATAHSRARDRGGPGPALRLRRRAAERRVFVRVRDTFGGRCRFVVSAGAPVDERLAHCYRGVGIPVLEGYGLAETSGLVAVTSPDDLRVGSAGRPLPGVALRIDEDGELLVSSSQTMSGYWSDDAARVGAFADPARRWLRTGDLAEIDAEGRLWVTGRRQELLITTGGKSVVPALLEDRIRAHPLVDRCLVVGDGRPYVAALLTLDHEAVAAWSERWGTRLDLRRPDEDPVLRRELQLAVDDANAQVSPAEAVRRFRVLPDQWSEDSGHLTPSLRLRRYAVLRDYREEVEHLYPPTGVL